MNIARHSWRHRSVLGRMRARAVGHEGSAAIRIDIIPLPPGMPMHKLQMVPSRDSHFRRAQRRGCAMISSSRRSTLVRLRSVSCNQNVSLLKIQPSTFLHVLKKASPLRSFLRELDSWYLESAASFGLRTLSMQWNKLQIAYSLPSREPCRRMTKSSM